MSYLRDTLRRLWQHYVEWTDRYFAGGQSCRRCVPQVDTQEPPTSETKVP